VNAVPIPLHLVRPPPLGSGQAFRRAVSIVERSGIVSAAESALHCRTGRPRDLSVRALLIGLAWHGVASGTNMHLTGVAALMARATAGQARELGLRRRVTYRQVETGFRQLSAACSDGLQLPHTHPVADVFTGEVLSCPGSSGGCLGLTLTLDDVADRLLAASVPRVISTTGSVALDSTDYETWARRLSWAKTADAHPDALPVTAPPTAPWRKGVASPGWPLLGDDGRLQHTHDADARAGHRSGSNGGRGEVFVGYDLHTLVDVPRFGHEPVPYVIRGMALRPAGAHKGHAGIDALDGATRTGLQVSELLADRGYTFCKPHTFALPLVARGVDCVLDLHSQQRGQRPGPVPCTVWVDGALFSTALPEALRTLEPATLGMTSAEKARRREEFDRRAPFAFRGHTAINRRVGTQRLKGPALAGTVRCPNFPASLRLPFTRPTTSCGAGAPCGCGLTITAGPDDYAREWQRRLWGTTGWAASYGRRTGVESFNAEIKKNHAAMDRGYTRVFGLTKNTLLLAFGLAGVNVRMLRDWHARRLLPDPWAVEIGEQHQPPSPGMQITRRRPRRQSLHMVLASRGHDPPDRPSH
jgi:hypothetical protein